MLRASTSFSLFDYFRVPYAVDPALRQGGLDAVAGPGGARLLWPAGSDGLVPAALWHLQGITLHARVALDPVARELLAVTEDESWRPAEPLIAARGEATASVWRSAGGGVFVPFDPGAAIAAYWRESYADERASAARAARAAARTIYYRARPLVPRAAQMRLRRRFTRIQSRTTFPRWPSEPSLHDLYEFLFDAVETVAEEPAPRLSEWPNGFAWSLVLTHDVETAAGYANVERIALIERELGFRSSWNFVPERDYRVEAGLLERLAADGFEIGVHGLRHDGRDLAPERSFAQRLPRMQAYGRRWGARGFRSPGTSRSWSRIARLGFDYDSSYTDSARFEPQPGGCCTWLPFTIGGVVELPITVPQDHTVFDLLRQADERLWLDKVMLVRERGGMALVLTHPDYMLEGNALRAYERLLATFADDPTVWKALPVEASGWWRRRGSSAVELSGDGTWCVAGEAEGEGHVAFGAPRGVDAAAERADAPELFPVGPGRG